MDAVNAKFSKVTYLSWYELMLRIRRFEERSGQLYGMQKIRGFCHLYIGQEAIAAGTISALQAEDSIITAYRDHGLALAKGITANECMAELFGKATGCTKGKGGSMHFFSKEKKFFGGHGIVGAQIPLGAGIAFSEKYLGTKNVCACFFGDGAARQGALHETFNMAMLWKIPVIFICENNEYAMGTSVERSSNVVDISKMGLAYDMPSFQVDGMRCESVHEAIAEAAERGRRGDGPTLLEIKTYRYKGHSMSDPAKYRSKDEVEEYKQKDPLETTLATIYKNKYATESDIAAINERITEEVNESVKFAEESPYPDPSEIYSDNYMEADYPFLAD
ncbi:MAG: pyruvate dehydrogenase (acetyl-transferring) E1 component subunit alpha [Chitinophagaceae bacterium]|nr:pyruvate dehydrogenase (acetyl-transferring) E1 component subunit alpha [Chitinophagaceae bacterium]